MKTYIINLKRSTDRKEYMLRQLEKLSFLLPEFVEAVDGRMMSDEERNEKFDKEEFQKQYLRECRPGEIGCTLSHQKCYRILAESEDKCALILEDDIIVHENLCEAIEKIEVLMDTEEPRIVLLSGWYWYLRTNSFLRKLKLADVYDGFLTHSYVINRSAARLLLEPRPYITADDWRYIRRKDVKLQAVLPHLVDQNWSGEFQTFVNVEKISKVYCGIRIRVKRLMHSVILKFLELSGRFEKA